MTFEHFELAMPVFYYDCSKDLCFAMMGMFCNSRRIT